MKHLFIVNPVAGGKDRREYVAEQARRALEGSEDAYEVYVTTAPMDAWLSVECWACILVYETDQTCRVRIRVCDVE